MRSEIWGFLGIEPTSDKKAIRSAYAAQSRLHHPEEEPEYFAKLNQAYRQALDLARRARIEEDDGEEGSGAGSRRNGEEGSSAGGRRNGEDGRSAGSRRSGEDGSSVGGRRGEDGKSGTDSGREKEVQGSAVGGSSREDKDIAGDRGEDRKSRDDRLEEADKKSRENREKQEDKTDEVSLLERLAGARQKAIQESMAQGALHDFITLFEDIKQAKAADTWRRFFLSEAFLGEQYTEEFASGLSAYLMEQQTFPCDNLPMGLLQELAIAYALIPHFAGEEYGKGMKYPKEWYKVSVEQTFPARKQVAEIFNSQGWDCDLKSMTRRMLKQPANKVRHNAFSDYLNLKEMGLKGRLTEAEKETWQHILGFGQVHYLYERNGKRPGGADYESRSECVVKLYVQWLKDEQLPECVLKFLYQKFSFRELDRSSTRGLYGALKEQVLRQLPQVEDLLFGQDGTEQKVTKVYRICSRIIYEHQNNFEKSIYEETPRIKEQIEALFAMPEWKELQKDRGLFDRLYSGAKRPDVPCSLAEGLIRYLQQGDFPEPKRTEFLESLLHALAMEQMCRERDYRCRLSIPAVDMDRLEESGDFWQYYLMRGYGFRHSRIRGAWEDGYLYEEDGECYLPAYIRYIYEPSRAWQRAFTGFSEETEAIADPVSAVCALPDGRCLRVEFHYHYCLYFVEEAPVLSPVLSFDELCRWAGEQAQAELYQGHEESDGQSEAHDRIVSLARTGAGRVRDFFFLLAVTAIEDSERREAEGLIQKWLEKLPVHSQICPLLARMLAADNDRLPAGTRSVCYEEQERFCFRAVVSGDEIRIYRLMEFGWEDRIFRRAEFGWKEILAEAIWRGRDSGLSSDPEEPEKCAREVLLRLRQPKPVRLAVRSLEGMDLLQKARAVLESMEFPEKAEGYCVLRYGQERRHDKVFYSALSPFGFPVGVHAAEYERNLNFHRNLAQTKIKEGKRYIGRFGWGFKYSFQSDDWPFGVYQGDSGMYYIDDVSKMHRADSLEKILADCLGPELEGVTEVETYGGLLTVSRLDHRLEYCYGEAEFQESVHGTVQTVADFFTVFGGYRLWETFARWMDAALEKGLPDWVNVLTIGQALGNGDGGLLSLTGSHVEEVNLDLLELQERLRAEDSRENSQNDSQDNFWENSQEDSREEDGEEKPAGGQEKRTGSQGQLGETVPEYEDYPLETPSLVWGKGLAVQTQRQTLRDAVRWYVEERQGDGAKLLQSRSVRVEIVDCSGFHSGQS